MERLATDPLPSITCAYLGRRIVFNSYTPTGEKTDQCPACGSPIQRTLDGKPTHYACTYGEAAADSVNERHGESKR